MPSPYQAALFDGSFSPYRLGGNEADYSVLGPASDSTYLKDGSDLIQLIADRSGKSATPGLVLNGVNSNNASTLDAAAIDIPGSIAAVFYGWADDWTPSTGKFFMAKRITSGSQISWNFSLETNGTLGARFSSDGAANAGEIVTSSVATGFADLSPAHVAVTRNGADVKFWTSTDGATWAQLGTTQTITNTGDIFNSTAPLTVGSLGEGTFAWSGGCYRARLYAGIPTFLGGAGGETLAFDANFTTRPKLTTSFTESSVNAATVTINSTGDTGARICGARDLYQGTSTKRAVYIPEHSGSSANRITTVARNSDFSALATDWASVSLDSLSAATGALVIVSTTANGRATLSTTYNGGFTVGRPYTLTLSVSDFTASGSPVSVLLGVTNQVLGNITGTGTFTFNFIATANAELQIRQGFVGSMSLTVDNISLQAAGSPVPYAYTDGTDDYYKSAPFPLVQPTSVYFGGSQVTWTNGDVFMDGTGASNRMGLAQTGTTPEIQMFADTSTAGNTGWAVGVRAVLSAIYSGATSSIRVNTGTRTTGSAGVQSGNGVTVGANQQGTVPASITFTTLLVRSVADSPALQSRVARFFMRLLRVTG